MYNPVTTVSPSLYFPRINPHSDASQCRCDTLIRRPSGSLIIRNRTSVPPNQDVFTLSTVTALFVFEVRYDTTNLRPTFDERICGKKMTPSSKSTPPAISTFG